MMEALWIIFQVLVGYNLVLPALLYLSTFFVSSKKVALPLDNNLHLDYAIIVTAYEQTHMLPSVLESLLKLTYENFHIYVVTDKCNETEFQFLHPKVSILKPEKVLASNIKSHFYAIERFVRHHDVLTIIDSDNLVRPNYINELNRFFGQGFKAVQGLRKSKSIETDIATLDSVRDFYYSYFDGEILFRLGSSSTLAGSGMAFDVQLYKDCLLHLAHVSGAGFDKLLQYEIVKRDIRIAHAPEAIVFDEKTSNSKQLVDQRSRWINSWFKYAGKGVALLVSGVRRRSLNQLVFGIIVLRPPIFISLLLSFVCFGAGIFISPFHAVIWTIPFSMFLFGFFASLYFQKAPKELYKSLMSVPKFIFYQIIALIHSKNANRRSVATKHKPIVTYDN